MKSAVINALESGLKPITKDLLGLLLYNNQPADLELTPKEHIALFENNMFDFDSSLTTNLAAQASAMAQWAGVAMKHMSEIAPSANPESADHIARFLKDMGKSMGLSTVAMDAYLPEGRPPQIQSQQPPQPGLMPTGMPQGAPPEPTTEQMMEVANVA